jgi:hypothetical protein
MSYKDKYGITKIKPNTKDNLSISWDTDEDEKKEAVILFTPDMGSQSEHFHIDLTLDETRELHSWLSSFLAENDPTHKKS